MAIRLPDNSIQLSSGKIIYADTPILGQDLAEVMALLAPPQHFVAFTGRGAGGGSGGPGGGGGSGTGSRGPRGLQGLLGLLGDGVQGSQGGQGFQGTHPGFQGPTGPDPADGMFVSSGTYIGDGNASQLVTTGLSFPIEMLWIHVIGPDSNIPAPIVIFKPGTVAGLTAGFLQLDADTEFSNEDVVEMTVNDFTVHLGVGDKSANNLGTTYHWVAITKPSSGLDDATFYYAEGVLDCSGGSDQPYGNSSPPYNFTVEVDCSDFPFLSTAPAVIVGVPGGTFTITGTGVYPDISIDPATGVLGNFDIGTTLGFYTVTYTTPPGPGQNSADLTFEVRDDG